MQPTNCVHWGNKQQGRITHKKKKLSKTKYLNRT